MSLWSNPSIRAAMALGYGGGMGNIKFLYETRPDYFPQGFLTETEMELWAMFLSEKSKKRKNNG